MSDLIPGSYFGGNASNLGIAKRLPQRDWRSLVREVFGQCVLVNLTREQYRALPKGERDRVKRVPFIVPCALTDGTDNRRVENVSHCDLIAVDIDSSHDARPFAANPELLKAALSPHPFLCYTTASSTEENPRLRVIVSAHRIPAAQYSKAVSYVVQRLGLKEVTQESLVCVQPMFLPTLFAGEDAAVHHPMLTSEESGSPVTLENTPTGDVKVSTRTTTAHVSTGGDDPLDFMAPRMGKVHMDDVREALGFIPPDIGYAKWLSVAAALKHQFSTDAHGDALAFALFDEWSAKGTKYVSSDETALKWKSLVPNPAARAPITLRSVFHYAVEHGMTPGKVSTRTRTDLQEWITATTDTGTLLGDGLKMIATAPLLDSIERQSLLGDVCKHLSKLGLKTSVSVVSSKYKKLEARLRYDPNATVAPAPEDQVPPWARGMTYIASDNVFVIRGSERQYTPIALDSMFGMHLMAGEQEPGDSGKPASTPHDFLLNVLRIPRADGLRYDPAHPHDAFLLDGGSRYLNTYRPTYPEGDKGLAAEAEDTICTHLGKLIAEPEYRTIVLDWCSCLVQQPGRKIRWAPLIQGGFGCGKTAIAQMMRQVLGTTNVKLVENSTIFGNFTGWGSGSQLACIEEIHIPGTARHQVMNMLKPRISNDRITVRRMHQEAVEEPNTTNYLLLTNFQDAVAPAEGDRRYFVIFSPLQTEEQVKSVPVEHYTHLYDIIDHRPAGLRYFLEHRTMTPTFNPDGHAPTTRYLRDMAGAALSPLAAAVRNAIDDADHPLVSGDLLSLRVLRTRIDSRATGNFSDQALSSILREAGYEPGSRVKLSGSNVRHQLWRHRSRFSGDDKLEVTKRLDGKKLTEDGEIIDL